MEKRALGIAAPAARSTTETTGKTVVSKSSAGFDEFERVCGRYARPPEIRIACERFPSASVVIVRVTAKVSVSMTLIFPVRRCVT